MSSDLSRRGVALGVGAYVIWGVLPLYLRLLHDVPAEQILAHRVLWSVAMLLLVVVVARRAATVRAALTGRVLAFLVASAGLIAVNWFVFIWSVGHGHTLDASLGYFINPLVNVALGVALLGERLRRVQGFAVVLAGAGVIVLAVEAGVAALWIPITLALSFGSYGLVRKVVAIDALGGLTVETLLLAPACVAVLLWAGHSGTGAFGRSTTIDLLLIGAGAVTALPLLMFTAAARALQYSTLGVLQYIGPTLQFAEAVTLFGEPLRAYHVLTFALIWSGCALFAWDGLRAHRRG